MSGERRHRGQEAEGEKGSVAKSLYCGFRGRNGRGKVRFAGLNNFTGLCGLGAVLSCLVPGQTGD